MTDAYPSTNNSGAAPQPGEVAGTAKDEAANVGHSVADSAKDVAGTVKEETVNVVGESKKQAKALYEESRTQLTEQAGIQQQRVAAGLRDIGTELQRMADSSDQPGVAGDVVSQVAARTSGAAAWLDGRDPGALLDEVKSFARRKPGTFIAISAVAGLLAGRLVRSLASEAADETASTEAATPSPVPASAGTPTTMATPIYDATLGNGSAS